MHLIGFVFKLLCAEFVYQEDKTAGRCLFGSNIHRQAWSVSRAELISPLLHCSRVRSSQGHPHILLIHCLRPFANLIFTYPICTINII